MYTLPQEVEVWYVIPAIRKELARLLTQKHKLSYEKAGKAMSVSKAAISQYQKNKRAGKIKLHSRVLREVDKSSDVIVKDNSKMVKEILRILDYMRENRLPFEICEGEDNCNEVYAEYWD